MVEKKEDRSAGKWEGKRAGSRVAHSGLLLAEEKVENWAVKKGAKTERQMAGMKDGLTVDLWVDHLDCRKVETREDQ